MGLVKAKDRAHAETPDLIHTPGVQRSSAMAVFLTAQEFQSKPAHHRPASPSSDWRRCSSMQVETNSTYGACWVGWALIYYVKARTVATVLHVQGKVLPQASHAFQASLPPDSSISDKFKQMWAEAFSIRGSTVVAFTRGAENKR